MSGQDDSVSNTSTNPHFADVLKVSMRRRRLLQGSLGAAALAFFGAPALTRIGEALAQGNPPAPSFLPVPALFADEVRVPQGYSVQVLYSWGDPTGMREDMPEFDADSGVSRNSAEQQALQAGMDHDGMHFFPLVDEDDDDRRASGGRRDRRNAGLLCVNHENIQREFLLDSTLSRGDAVAKMKNAHGVSVIEVRETAHRQWEVVRPSRYARRITADTPMRIFGPGRSAMMVTRPPVSRSAARRSCMTVL